MRRRRREKNDATRRRFSLRYPGRIPTTRGGIRQCGAIRVRARAPLSAATVSATLSRMYVWHGTTMRARTQTGGSDGRLVPPRLRRAAHLLTEYHRDSYIATIVLHTSATRTAAAAAAVAVASCPCSRERCFDVNPEARSRSPASSSSSDSAATMTVS